MNCVQKFVWATVLFAFCFMCAMTAAPADDQSDAARLANEITKLSAQEFKIDLPDASVEIVGPLELRVSRAGTSWHAYLYNLYLSCQRNTENCGQAIVARAWQFKVAHQNGDAPLSKSNLRVVVRDGEHVDELKQRYGDDINALVQPLCGDLWVIVVEDSPTMVTYPKPAAIKALGFSVDDGFKLAVANTKMALKGRVPKLAAKDKANLSVFVGDDFVTTFAFPELWAPVAQTFGGTLIVAIPSTDQMFIIGDDTPDALQLMHKAVDDEWAHAERPLSRSLFGWTEKGWVEIPASPDQPVSQAAPKSDATSQAATPK